MHFWEFTGILLSIPYGRLADNVKYGRKFVLSLAVVGLLLGQFWVLLVCWFSRVMSLRAVWLGSAALFIGGGAGVALAMLMTMITDVVEARYRCEYLHFLLTHSINPSTFSLLPSILDQRHFSR